MTLLVYFNSNPCLVAEYALDDQSAIFMTVLPPTTHYSNSIKFTHPATEDETSTGLDQYINIIITGEPASSGITLDGTDISGLTWTQAVDYSYITLVEDGNILFYLFSYNLQAGLFLVKSRDTEMRSRHRSSKGHTSYVLKLRYKVKVTLFYLINEVKIVIT